MSKIHERMPSSLVSSTGMPVDPEVHEQGELQGFQTVPSSWLTALISLLVNPQKTIHRKSEPATDLPPVGRHFFRLDQFSR
jgi:hypothetical protein